MTKVKIQALPVKEGKRQHMTIGRVYEVSEDTAKTLIDAGKATKADGRYKVGEVYELPKKKGSSLTD